MGLDFSLPLPKIRKMVPQRLAIRCMCILALMVLKYGPSSWTYAQSNMNFVSYARQSQTAYLPFVPHRMSSAPWANIPNPLACGHRALSSYPESRGFLYNYTSGLCTPLLWLQGPNAPGAQQLQAGEGELYLSSELCPVEFAIMEVGNSGELACLKYVAQSLVPMAEADSHCKALGSHLVHVKTLPKLNLIRSFATASLWVGLKYLRAEGLRVWTGDGRNLTSQEIQEVFMAGEPNDSGGIEDCAEFNNYAQVLNDIACNETFHYVCEMDLPVLGIE